MSSGRLGRTIGQSRTECWDWLGLGREAHPDTAVWRGSFLSIPCLTEIYLLMDPVVEEMGVTLSRGMKGGPSVQAVTRSYRSSHLPGAEG